MYREAFFSAIAATKPRERPDERLAKLAAGDGRPELKQFFELAAAHGCAAVTAGDFSLWFHLGDDSPDGDGVCIGATHGGDVFVVAAPGATDPRVRLLSHEEDWAESDTWPDLEAFLEERINEHRERMQDEFPDDEDEWKTDLDPFLQRGTP